MLPRKLRLGLEQKRMKLKQSKQLTQSLLAGAALVGACTGLVSCGASNTIDYLYSVSATNNPGQINVYRVDSQSGALTQIPDSPYSTGGRNPQSLVIDGSGLNLYVANHDDNSIVQFAIGTDAKLYGQHTVNPTGSEPVSVAVHSYYNSSGVIQGSILLVVESLQPNFTDLNRGPGGLYVYKLDATGALTSASVTQTVNGVAQAYYPLGNIPLPTSALPTVGAVNITNDGLSAYVTDILAAGETLNGCAPGQGGIEGFNLTQRDSNGVPTGVITAAPRSPYCGPTNPSAIASHPFSSFLYVTDSSQNQIVTYGIDRSVTSGGAPTATFGTISTRPAPPVATGTTPDGVVVDPRGLYVYVSNKIGGNLSSYTINLGTGQLSPLATGSAVTAAQPGCVIVEPALGRFVYTANFLAGSISGFTLDPSTGALAGTQNAPYNTSGLSQCVAATQHGNHAVIQPSNTAG